VIHGAISHDRDACLEGRKDKRVPEPTRETQLFELDSLLPASRFPDRRQIFPALATREFCSSAIEFYLESAGVSAISSPKSAISLYFPAEQGTCKAETRSLMTASTATQSLVFPEKFSATRLSRQSRGLAIPKSAQATTESAVWRMMTPFRCQILRSGIRRSG
jgi:hypothetical protein